MQRFVYFARGLISSELEGDEDYPILIEQVSLNTFEDLVLQGRLCDARVIAALALARHVVQTQNAASGEYSSDFPERRSSAPSPS